LHRHEKLNVHADAKSNGMEDEEASVDESSNDTADDRASVDESTGVQSERDSTNESESDSEDEQQIDGGYGNSFWRNLLENVFDQ